MKIEDKHKCLFCQSTVEMTGSSKIRTSCPICGVYLITDTALVDETTFTKEEGILFSGYIRNFSTEDAPLEIYSYTLKQIPQLVERYKTLPVDEKIRMLIIFLAKSSKCIGESIPLDSKHDFTRFFLKEPAELSAIISHLIKTGLINASSIGTSKVYLTIPGWGEYEKLKEINLESKKAFVAMNFDKTLKFIFDDAIKPACEECGFEAIRIDLVHHNEKICEKIIAEIKESRFYRSKARRLF